MRIARVIVWLGVSSCVGVAQAQERRPAPAYTNADLERVAPLRAETGASSTPALTTEPAPGRAASRRGGRAGRATATEPASGDEFGEAYWRREAAHVAERVSAWRAAADEIRAQLAERKRPRPASGNGKRGGANNGAAQLASLERKLAALELRIREAESQLEDRARRARALPGWLR